MKFLKNQYKKIGLEFKNGFWITFSSFFVSGVSFLTIPIFTRLLEVNDFGEISLFITWSEIVSIFIGLNLSASIMRAKNQFKDDFDGFLFSILLLSFISFAFFMLIFTIFNIQISSFFNIKSTIYIVAILNGFFLYIYKFNDNINASNFLYKRTVFFSMFRTLFSLILSLIFIMLLPIDKYMGRIIGIFVVNLMLFLMIIVGIKKQNFKFKLNYWKYALIYSLPMIAHSFAHLLLGQSDKVIINNYLGSNALGLYSFAYTIGSISLILLTSLNKSWTPWFFNQFENKNFKILIQKARDYTNFFTIITIFIIYLSPEIVVIMAPKEYSQSIMIIPIILVSYYFQYLYTLLINIQFYLKKHYLIPLTTILTVLINIILNLWLVPIWGYESAAYTTLLAYFLLFAVNFIITNMVLKIKLFNLQFFIKYIVLIISALIVFYYLILSFYLRLFIIFIYLIYMYLEYKKIYIISRKV